MSILRNNQTGEYAGPYKPDDPQYRALIKLRESGNTNRPLWADTGVEALEDSEKVAQPSFVAVIPPTAAANSDTQPLGTMEAATTITAVTYYPNAEITGAATNSRSLLIKDATSTAATLAFVAGVNAGPGSPGTATITTAAVAEGDVLTAESLSVGTGIADPGGTVVVTFAGNVAESSHDFEENPVDE